MKSLLLSLVTICFLPLNATAQLDSKKPKEIEFLNTLPSYSDDELFDMKYYFAKRSRSNTDAILLSIGLPTLATGIVLNSLQEMGDNSSGPRFAMGIGGIMVLIGIFSNNNTDTRKEILIERELFRRKTVSLKASTSGLRLTF